MRLRSAILVAALAATGCTSPDPQPQVASAARPTATASAAAPAPSVAETDYDKALRFTRCMNALGENIPDPVEGKPIQTTSQKRGDWMIPSPNFPKCQQYLPATWPVRMDPKDIARERPFGECLRKRGIDWPEPDANGMVHYPANPDEQESEEYRAAVEACRYLYDDPANNQ